MIENFKNKKSFHIFNSFAKTTKILPKLILLKADYGIAIHWNF